MSYITPPINVTSNSISVTNPSTGPQRKPATKVQILNNSQYVLTENIDGTLIPPNSAVTLSIWIGFQTLAITVQNFSVQSGTVSLEWLCDGDNPASPDGPFQLFTSTQGASVIRLNQLNITPATLGVGPTYAPLTPQRLVGINGSFSTSAVAGLRQIIFGITNSGGQTFNIPITATPIYPSQTVNFQGWPGPPSIPINLGSSVYGPPSSPTATPQLWTFTYADIMVPIAQYTAFTFLVAGYDNTGVTFDYFGYTYLSLSPV